MITFFSFHNDQLILSAFCERPDAMSGWVWALINTHVLTEITRFHTSNAVMFLFILRTVKYFLFLSYQLLLSAFCERPYDMPDWVLMLVHYCSLKLQTFLFHFVYCVFISQLLLSGFCGRIDSMPGRLVWLSDGSSDGDLLRPVQRRYVFETYCVKNDIDNFR